MRKLVLWGHNPEEYKEMFDLSDQQLDTKILEYGCGPSAFNALQTEQGNSVVSVDPLFMLDKDTLYSKAVLLFAEMLKQVLIEKEKFDFSREGSLENLIAHRRKGMEIFFKDYAQGKKAGRYIGVNDYSLPFEDGQFDIALVSHYLFAGLDNQDVDFHLHVLKELARVAKEVRIFPLIDRMGETSEFLGPVLLGLQQENYGAEVRNVAYHLQKQGNAMLRIWAQECKLD